MIKLAQPYYDFQETGAVSRVLDGGWIMQGPQVARFEQSLAEFCRVKRCVAVSSGTAALHLCMLALGVGAGWKVFVPSFAWPSAANLTRLLGAQLVLIDSERESYNLNIDQLENKVREFRRYQDHPALMVPVHQFGVPCDMDRLAGLAAKYSIELLEDSACGLGSFVGARHVGSFGRAGVLSFHPRKIITTGEGGAVITNDDKLADLVTALRNHGFLQFPGLNYRMTDMQAALGIEQMKKLDSIIDRRAKVLRSYSHFLTDRDGFRLPDYLRPNDDDDSHRIALQTLMILLDKRVQRDSVVDNLATKGVEARPASVAAHMLPAFADVVDSDEFPVAAVLHQQGLALPLHAGMTEDDSLLVANALLAVLSSM